MSHILTIFCHLVVQSESVEQHRDVLERPAAAAALAGLISFATLTSDSSGLGKYQLGLYDPGRYVPAALLLPFCCAHLLCCRELISCYWASCSF